MSNLDILFIKPNSKKINYQILDDYQMTAIEPPFWALLLSAYLESKGMECGILDMEVSDIWFTEHPLLTVITVCGQNPSASTQSMVNLDQLISQIRERYPKTKIMLHGLHPSCFPQETLEQYDVDFVCEGEGFLTIFFILIFLKHKKYEGEINGLWVNNLNQFTQGYIQAKPPILLDDISILPEIDWSFVDVPSYRAHNWHCFGNIKDRQPYGILYTSLGCPYKCDFCCIHTMFGKKRGIRYRSLENIRDDLYNLARHGIVNVKVMDELFTISKQRTQDICKEIINYGYGFNFWAYARVETIDSTTAKLLKEAGFNWLGIGFESGSQKILDASHKNQKIETSLEAVHVCKEEGINIGANFIFGLPEDTLETMEETLELALMINAEWVNFYSCMAYPGSKLYDDVQNFPWYDKPKTWSAYSQYSYDCQPLGTKTLTPAGVLKFRDDAFHTYFTNFGYLRMIREKFGKETYEYIRKMTEVKLKRKLLGD